MKRKVISFVLIITTLAMFVTSGVIDTTVFAGAEDFVIEDGVLTEYYGDGGDVVIPNSVTSIGNGAFYGCNSLTSVTIPNSVNSIDYMAFAGCKSLSSVTIPDSVSFIGDYAFYDCESLINVTIPSSVTNVDICSFGNCDNLKNINVSESNTDYSSLDGVLFDKEKTKLITCPAGKCGNVTLPDSVNVLNYGSFFGCDKVTSLTIPVSVVSIDHFALCIGDGLKDVFYVGSEVQWNLITDENGDIATPYLENGVKLHYNYTASAQLTIVQQPYSKIITLGESAAVWVTATGTELTYQWYGKKSGETSWSKLNEHTAYYESFIPDASWNGMQLYCKITDCTGKSVNSEIALITVINAGNDFVIEDGVLKEYKGKNKNVVIPDGVKKIGCVRWGESELDRPTSVFVPDSVVEIGDSAFEFCDELSNINIPESVKIIGNEAFWACNSLKEITLPDSLVEIGSDAFGCCFGFTSVRIPKSVKKIGTSPFIYCINLEKIEVDPGNQNYISLNGVLYNNPPAIAKRQGGRYVVTGFGLLK